VQRLDASAEHLGAAGEIRDGSDLETSLAQDTLGVPRGQQLPAEVHEAAREVDEPRLVVGREDRAPLRVRHGPASNASNPSTDGEPAGRATTSPMRHEPGAASRTARSSDGATATISPAPMLNARYISRDGTSPCRWI